MTKRDITDELLQIKLRRGRDHAMARFDTSELTNIIARAKSEHDVVLQLIPVRAVTLIEVMTRSMVAALIDKGSPYLGNAEAIFKKLDHRADFKLILALYGQTVTVGDVLAHMIRLNKLDDINGTMTALTGAGYFTEISLVHDRWAVEVEGNKPAPILGEKSAWYPTLERMFDLRHIIVHETSSYDILSASQARQFADVAERFLKASWEFLSNTLEPNSPLTQTAMNIAAGQSFAKADEELQELVRRIEENLVDSERELTLFRDAHAKWLAFRGAQVLSRYDPEGGGTIGPLYRAHEAESLTRDRIKFCSWWLNREEGEF